MISVVAKIFAKSPPAILIVFGGILALVENSSWGIFVGLGVFLQILWLLVMASR